MATLGVSSAEFYDMTPAEFWYALREVGEKRRSDQRSAFEVARYQAFLVINLTSQTIKEPITDPRKVAPLPWEDLSDLPGKDKKKTLPKAQTQDELASSVKSIARAFKAKVVKRHPDDPPTRLMKKENKDGSRNT